MNHKQIIKLIQDNLTKDLLKPEYINKSNNKYYGHCYVATECFYHLLSYNEKLLYKPQILKVGDVTHWFLKNIKNNTIIDITKEQFNFSLDYSKAKGCGFLTKKPSKRAIELTNRFLFTLVHHHKLIYSNTIILFFNINVLISLERSWLKIIKYYYLNNYDNCIIYNDYDLSKNKKIIRDKINRLSHKNINIKIHGRKCEIREIHNSEKNNFLNEYHIQGVDKSQIFLGAFFCDDLISVMCFDFIRGLNGGIGDCEYELSRFATKKNLIINGIFNKLIMYFIKIYNPKKIFSFGDLNLVNPQNNIYINNKFKLTKTIAPSFSYFHNNKLYHKLSFGSIYKKKNNLSDIEYNNFINSLPKVWNCGKLKYELFIEDNKIVFGYIYKITNTVNNKIYIGQTIRPLIKRIYEYKSWVKNNRFHNNYLGNSFIKYGFDNFKFEVIDTAINIDELNIKEINWINRFKSSNKSIGYNIEDGGRNSLPSKETLFKMSQSHVGIKQTNNWINKRISPSGSDDAKKYGKEKSYEEKLYLSINSPKYWSGKSRSIDTIEKIKKTKLKNGLSLKQKSVICKKVLAYNPINNNKIGIYESTMEASKNFDISQSTISRRCSGKANNKGDVYFKYL